MSQCCCNHCCIATPCQTHRLLLLAGIQPSMLGTPLQVLPLLLCINCCWDDTGGHDTQVIFTWWRCLNRTMKQPILPWLQQLVSPCTQYPNTCRAGRAACTCAAHDTPCERVTPINSPQKGGYTLHVWHLHDTSKCEQHCGLATRLPLYQKVKLAGAHVTSYRSIPVGGPSATSGLNTALHRALC